MSFKAMHPNQARDNSIISQMSQNEIIKKIEKGSVSFTGHFRHELWKSHHKKCAYCGIDLESVSDMRIDHFIPKYKVLDNSVENLISSCKRCNSIKGKSDMDYFRFSLAVSNSVLYGIILPNVAKKLLDIGIELPIVEKPFYFETLLGGAK
ncbi:MULTISPECIES: HNH endonuclease [Moraxella]|uniref:Uncharacterized protein conserved in bacteria n=2 Tax=Moraxella TaxID=475 RepID=A0A378QNY0_9GAMM|nr:MULTISPECIES: HNH endonuclease signature motif containing protein [Moraxella]OPH36276.1 hypothetical protein B5J93_09465 [Moraxella equi]STY93410.1 Uncharacterized protein conserved in bacteria [Moraxella bovis]STZ02004.1 Uncharacterized protein conserved in bacteria [Moraxella equi]